MKVKTPENSDHELVIFWLLLTSNGCLKTNIHVPLVNTVDYARTRIDKNNHKHKNMCRLLTPIKLSK